MKNQSGLMDSHPIEWVDINSIKLNPNNTNKHPKDQIERLAKIIQYQGWRWPLLVRSSDRMIAAGEGRYLAAKKLKLKKVPVSFQEFLDEDQFKAFVTSDNAIASWAEIDLSKVNEELASFDPSFDIELLGLKDFKVDVTEHLEPQCDEDEVPEVVEPITKPGDLWILGVHRLLCGDSTNIQHVERLMDGQKADMVFTDPPYGMKFEAEAFGYENIKGDHEDFTPDLINTIFQFNCDEVFIWGADYFAEHIPDRNNGAMLVWDKFPSDINSDRIGSSFEICWSRMKHKRHLIKVQQPFGKFATKRVHPTQKPVQLAEWFFEKWGQDKVNIVDLYGGSGSTLIACEKTKRKCFMMELDPHYCDIIVQRWERYTGRKGRIYGQEEVKEIEQKKSKSK